MHIENSNLREKKAVIELRAGLEWLIPPKVTNKLEIVNTASMNHDEVLTTWIT
jgi:hypothetical protein